MQHDTVFKSSTSTSSVSDSLSRSSSSSSSIIIKTFWFGRESFLVELLLRLKIKIIIQIKKCTLAQKKAKRMQKIFATKENTHNEINNILPKTKVFAIKNVCERSFLSTTFIFIEFFLSKTLQFFYRKKSSATKFHS